LKSKILCHTVFAGILSNWHPFCIFLHMKAKTLFYCPCDENELLFEEVYDELQDFAYQPPRELPQVCPKCGKARYKKDCIIIEELYRSDCLQKSGEACAQDKII